MRADGGGMSIFETGCIAYCEIGSELEQISSRGLSVLCNFCLLRVVVSIRINSKSEEPMAIYQLMESVFHSSKTN